MYLFTIESLTGPRRVTQSPNFTIADQMHDERQPRDPIKDEEEFQTLP